MEQCFELQPEALVGVGSRERAAALGKTEDELAERVGTAFEKRLRKTARRHHAERVAIPARVFGRDQPFLTRDPRREGTPLGDEDRRLSFVVLPRAQVAAAAENVV